MIEKTRKNKCTRISFCKTQKATAASVATLHYADSYENIVGAFAKSLGITEHSNLANEVSK